MKKKRPQNDSNKHSTLYWKWTVWHGYKKNRVSFEWMVGFLSRVKKELKWVNLSMVKNFMAFVTSSMLKIWVVSRIIKNEIVNKTTYQVFIYLRRVCIGTKRY